ncbi:MAG: T9SS type A sorting domain-containing protein [Saprospiraceae bacterium]|nr:T9SS type A sorting domain-containing protein [Saprospiraceae bacterium]
MRTLFCILGMIGILGNTSLINGVNSSKNYLPVQNKVEYRSVNPVDHSHSLSFRRLHIRPSDRVLKILPSTLDKFSGMAIYDLLGKLRYSLKFTEDQSDIDISSWPEGIYLIKYH